MLKLKLAASAALYLIILYIPFPCRAQKTDSLRGQRLVTHATLIGTGRSSVYETYLSPTTYSGPHVSLLHETLRRTRWAHGRVTTQSIVDGFFSFTHNHAGNSDEYGGKINYSLGYHYNWLVAGGKLRLMAGGELHAGGGAFYLERNSNNPVQAKADIDINASVIAIFPFRIRQTPFTLRYQASLLLIGAMFSPNYGQSYYEISLGNYDHNVCFTHTGNAPTTRHYITLDFPIGNVTLRAGYLCDIRQSRVNNLRSHIWNNSFLIGYVKHFSLFKRKSARQQPFIF